MALDKLLNEEGAPKFEGQSPEIAGKTGKNNQPGIYKHKDTGAQLITAPGSQGVAQADAFVRLGFVYVGPVPTPNEIRQMQAEQRQITLAEEAAEKQAAQSVLGAPAGAAPNADVSELLARIKAAEDRADVAEGRATKAEEAATTAAEAAEKAAKALETFTAPTDPTDLTEPTDKDAKQPGTKPANAK